jgi:hypothetical protein
MKIAPSACAIVNCRVSTPSFAPLRRQNQLPVFDASVLNSFGHPPPGFGCLFSRRQNPVVDDSLSNGVETPELAVKTPEFPE